MFVNPFHKNIPMTYNLIMFILFRNDISCDVKFNMTLTFIIFSIVTIVTSHPLSKDDLIEHGRQFVECVDGWMDSGETFGTC